MGQIWYGTYGSNLAVDRVRCYLAGGRPAGGAREYGGWRDPRDPARIQGVEVPGGIVFASESGVWGDGMAFFDRSLAGVAACRAYLITADQFGDIAAQARRRPPGGEFARDLAGLLPDVETMVAHGPGHYETVVRLGELDGAPMFTITHHDVPSLTLSAPAAVYLRWISVGLREAHGYDAAQIARYLAAAPGAAGAWSESELEALADSEPIER